MKEECVHIYERSPTNRKIFRCVAPNCSHYWTVEFIVGKYARCFYCFQPFVLSKEMLKRKRPHCGCLGRVKEPGLVNWMTEVLK